MPVNYSITESIPVADHVYKYLVKRYGSDTVTATRNDIIGNIVLSSLNRNSDIKLAKPKFNKVFNVVIKENHYLRNGVFIGVKHGQVFNNMVDKLFRDEMYFHVFINNSEDKAKFLEGIRKYLSLYDITEDDIKLESLYRDFKRKKDEYNLTVNN
jgi:hypothetical protein